MSVLNQINSVVSNKTKNSWTADQIKLYFGMKALGYSRKDIASVTGHSVHSCSYLSRRFDPAKVENADAKLEAITGFNTIQQYTDFVNQYATKKDEQTA